MKYLAPILLLLCTLGATACAEATLSVLVVVDQEDARSERITEFLKQGGMASKVTTYEKVTTRACDGADVVLADSKLFDKKVAESVQRARKFPRTRSPIVAVGYLGTKLIQGQGVAMASGYI
jgi:DNA-binding response OmpR family regulator